MSVKIFEMERSKKNEPEVTSLSGPVEEIDGQLVLFIPLEAGDDQFIESSRGTGKVEYGYLKIIIPEWLSGLLRIRKGSTVSVDNQDGKFNIHPIDPLPLQ